MHILVGTDEIFLCNTSEKEKEAATSYSDMQYYSQFDKELFFSTLELFLAT